MSDIIQTELGSLVNFQRGYDLPKSEFIDGIYPVISSNGVLGYHNEYKVKGSGITIGRSGTIGLPHFIDMDFFPHNTSLFIQDFKGNDKKYIFYLLKNLSLNQMGSGSGVPTLNRNHLHPLKVSAYIDVKQQQKISTVLSSLDAKIELNNRINAELEAMAKTLYDYWFVQFDFPDANGKPYKTAGGKMVYNEVLKREIPEGWGATQLSEITPVSNQTVNPADSPDHIFRHYSIPVYDATKTFGLEAGVTIGSNKFTVEESDILVSKLNPWFSRVIYAMDEENIICSTELVVWRTPNSGIKNFLYMVATSPQFIAHCTQSATGTSNSHKRVNPSVMMRLEIPFNTKMVMALGEKLEPMIKQLIINQRENTELAKLRDWLLPMLMNGQVTVT